MPDAGVGRRDLRSPFFTAGRGRAVAAAAGDKARRSKKRNRRRRICKRTRRTEPWRRLFTRHHGREQTPAAARMGASAGVPGSLAGPRAAPSLLVSVGARPHRSAELRARTEPALQRGRELGRGRGGALEEMKSKGLLPNITTYVTLTRAMYATQRMQVGEKLLEDIQERGLIPSKHSESLERRMEDAIRRLNMIRNCRKGMPVKEVEVLPVESFQ